MNKKQESLYSELDAVLSRLTFTLEEVSIRTESGSFRKVPGEVCGNLAVTKAYPYPPNCYTVTHVPTGYSIEQTANGINTESARRIIAGLQKLDLSYAEPQDFTKEVHSKIKEVCLFVLQGVIPAGYDPKAAKAETDKEEERKRLLSVYFRKA